MSESETTISNSILRPIKQLRKQGYGHRKQKKASSRKSAEEKRLAAISRLRNEEHIKELTQRIMDLLLERTKELFVEREVIKARKLDPSADVKRVKEHALKVCGKWTYKNVRPTVPSHLLVGQILTKYEICSWKAGYTLCTWHIALNNCGGQYKKECPLDSDDLPVEPPGAKRTDIMSRIMKKANRKVRKGVLGIVSDRDRDRKKRDARSEWRYFLLRFEKGDGKLDEDGNSPGFDRQIELMNQRQKGEKHQKALLKEAASVPIKKSANMVDAVLDAWNKEEN